MRDGIAVGGSILVDHIKRIDIFPREGMLTPILSESHAIGGCVTNTGISLKRLDPSLRVVASGCVGSDEWGRFVLDAFHAAGLETSGVHRLSDTPTGYTDVFSTGGTRTFFVNTGANDAYAPECVDFDALNARMLHTGYLLLLKQMDAPDGVYGTHMARMLHEARRRDIITSIDAVSEDSDRFHRIVPAALPYCNYVVFNEIEASRTVGIAARDASGALIWDSLPALCEALLALGVETGVVIHCPEAGIFMDARGKWACVRSLQLPPGFVQGSLGAGDAFCAGVLHGLYTGMDPTDMLRLANCAAAGCLSRPDATSGVGRAEEMLRLKGAYGLAGDVWTDGK